jgi:hypothetical protein
MVTALSDYGITMDTKHIFSGIKGIIKHEGVISLISRGFAFLLHRGFIFEDYYVILTKINISAEEHETDFLPETDNYYLHIISTNREADALAANGFDFTAYELNLRASLNKGAVVFCIFIGKELAHIVCAADNLRGKDNVDPRPFAVNFKDGEIVTGRALTVPKFRRLHLRIYSGYMLRKFCREKCISRIKGTVRANNYATLVNMAQFTFHNAVSKCRFIKILWFRHLKETKMEPTAMRQIFEQEYGRSRKEKDTIIPIKN